MAFQMTHPLSLHSRFRISTDTVFCDVDGEAVILSLRSGSYFGLDEVGTRMWVLLQSAGELREVVDVLLAEYDADAKQIEHDLIALVSQLAEKGLGEFV
jgi:hypothetical protein